MRNTLREVVKPRRSIRKRKQTQAAEMSLSAKEQRAKMVRDFVKRNKLCNKTESQWSQQEIHKLARQLHSSQSKNERWNRTMAALATQGHKWGCRPGEENNCSEEKEDKGLYFKRTGN